MLVFIVCDRRFDYEVRVRASIDVQTIDRPVHNIVAVLSSARPLIPSSFFAAVSSQFAIHCPRVMRESHKAIESSSTFNTLSRLEQSESTLPFANKVC